MPNLVAEIKKNANKFGQMPIGPIGLEIKLKKDISNQEAALIEIELGDVLKSFIVDSFQDRTLLNRLMQKCGMNTTVTTVSTIQYIWIMESVQNLLVNQFFNFFIYYSFSSSNRANSPTIYTTSSKVNVLVEITLPSLTFWKSAMPTCPIFLWIGKTLKKS